MTNRLVAYVTDPGYLLPSLISACQLSAADGARAADIAIFTVSVPDDVVSRLQSVLSRYRFQFIPMDEKTFMPSSSTYFREGHVPKAALGRLVLSQYVPAQYDHIVYIDGDTQVCGDVSALLNYDVPEGRVAAVSESFFLERPSLQRADYLKGLGLDDPERYFNSGVLAFRKSTWERVGPEALDYFFRNPTLCQFHDQSALNAVCRDRRVTLDPAYNFHSGFAELCVARAHPPRIVHFTGREKPWNYQVWPWSGRFAKPYRDFLDGNRSLSFALDVKFSSGSKQLARGFYKAFKYRNQYSDIRSRRRRFLDYLDHADFPF
jgi:lipopolysaccharide biosynthesis glycosyltransferase